MREDNLGWRVEILNLDTELTKIKDLEYRINMEIDNERKKERSCKAMPDIIFCSRYRAVM